MLFVITNKLFALKLFKANNSLKYNFFKRLFAGSCNLLLKNRVNIGILPADMHGQQFALIHYVHNLRLCVVQFPQELEQFLRAVTMGLVMGRRC